MMNLMNVLLMAPPTQGANQNPLMQFLPLILIGIVFYFFMIRPQAKKAKQQKQFINNLQKGDKIVTIAGIHGKVNKVNDDSTLEMEVSPGSYIKIERSAISMEWTANINKPATEVKK